MSLDIFTKLKIKRNFSKKEKNISNLFFQILADDNGYYLNIINEKHEKVSTFDHKNYNGATRDIIKYIEKIKEQNIYKIEWFEESKDKIYLYENEFLLDLLKKSDKVIDSQYNELNFIEGYADILLELSGDKNFESKISLKYNEQYFSIKDFTFLSEKFLLSANRIYEIMPIGDRFNVLDVFQTSFSEKDIERFLSLFYSYFENIYLNYKDYNKVDGEIIETKPTLIFEEIDSENNLHIKISESIQGFEPDFIESYNISKIAKINELEKSIVISDLINQNIHDDLNSINKLLNKYKKSMNDENINFYNQDNLFIIEENLAREFIHKELTSLLLKYSVFGSEKLKSYNIRTVEPKLKLNLSYGVDFFEGTVNLDIEGQLISAFDAINFYKKNSYIQLSDGTNAIVNKSYIDKLSRIFKKSKDKVKLSFFDLPLIEELIDEKIYQESFYQYREIFLGFNQLNDKIIKLPKVNAELRSYQEQGYKWLKYLNENSLGGCLADDMGLGKTLQTITLLSSIYPEENKPSLVVMPKSLLFNWENEIKKFNPEISYYIYYANNRNIDEAVKNNLIFTTYAILRNEVEKFKDIKFNYVILDESQNIKNVNSQSSKAVMLINSENRLALSGTPIENNLSELYSLFRFLNPTMFGSLDEFNTNYIVPVQKENDKNAIQELRKKIYPFILRRLKKDVLKDLPEKIEQTLFVDMSEEQRQFYHQRRAFYYHTLKEQIASEGIKKSQFFILQALTELRQIASIPEVKSDENIISPKRELLIENILDVIANGHKVLVFANYLSALDYISEDLNKNGIEHLVMTGSTRDRKELVEKFQTNSSYRAFLMTLKTGGVGLNLTAADYVFIFDPWWNKSAENQAIDRSHRMGQDKTVFSYKIITKDTIEEKILQLQEKKMELFDNIISSDDTSIKSFDESDIDFILGS